MNIHFKMTRRLRAAVLADLTWPHAFAFERVAFLACQTAYTSAGLLLLAQSLHPVDDEDYLPDDRVGAMMGPGAIRKALELAYNTGTAIAHVHCHEHSGRPWFSGTDGREAEKFMPDFFKVCPRMPHAALVLSRDSAAGLCWTAPADKPEVIGKISFVGSPLEVIYV